MELEDPESFEILFYDLLSETCSYLQQRGFQTESNWQKGGEHMRGNSEREAYDGKDGRSLRGAAGLPAVCDRDSLSPVGK